MVKDIKIIMIFLPRLISQSLSDTVKDTTKIRFPPTPPQKIIQKFVI